MSINPDGQGRAVTIPIPRNAHLVAGLAVLAILGLGYFSGGGTMPLLVTTPGGSEVQTVVVPNGPVKWDQVVFNAIIAATAIYAAWYARAAIDVQMTHSRRKEGLNLSRVYSEDALARSRAIIRDRWSKAYQAGLELHGKDRAEDYARHNAIPEQILEENSDSDNYDEELALAVKNMLDFYEDCWTAIREGFAEKSMLVDCLPYGLEKHRVMLNGYLTRIREKDETMYIGIDELKKLFP